MPIERIIGIDFGTSTSVVKVKTYKDNQPIGSVNGVEYIHFDNKASLPTLVYVTEDGRHLIGYEAENAAVKGILHQNFKINLISTEETLRKEAISYAKIFFEYMYRAYDEQKSHFPDCDLETTYVSYPAKWPDEIRQLMISIAEGAGFVNVIGLDEPTAAIHTVMVQEKEKLVMGGQDYIHMLMVDMGAGTTDLVLCRYSPYEEKKITVLNTWPKADSTSLLGGREIDEAICEYIKAYLIDCGLKNTKNFNMKYQDKCKTWKEANISPIFREKDGVVKYCGFIDTLLAMLDVNKDFPPMTRTDFEDMLESYLSQYPQMITDCLKDIGFDQSQLDYVILTGGHSQWYFTHEVLEGKLTRFGVPDLPKIKEDPKRIIKLSIPQETVAIGLVLQKIAVKHPERPSIKVTGIINMIAGRFIDRTGVDLLSDSAALKRMEEAARKAVIELETADRTSISIPYISANFKGPMHLTETITNSELSAFIQRYKKNEINSNNRKEDINKESIKKDESRQEKINQEKVGPDEKLCVKCGKKITRNSIFCSYCGTRNEDTKSIPVQPDIFCVRCGKKISSADKFCCYCGAPTESKVPDVPPGPAPAAVTNKPVNVSNVPRQITLIIKREMQFICSGVFYRVKVNGIDYGSINIGQSKTIAVTSPVAALEINCTTPLLTNHHLHCRLRLGNNPSISFNVVYPGEIHPAFTDAEIIEYY